jgi:hypothetical protein
MDNTKNSKHPADANFQRFQHREAPPDNRLRLLQANRAAPDENPEGFSYPENQGA